MDHRKGSECGSSLRLVSSSTLLVWLFSAGLYPSFKFLASRGRQHRYYVAVRCRCRHSNTAVANFLKIHPVASVVDYNMVRIADSLYGITHCRYPAVKIVYRFYLPVFIW